MQRLTRSTALFLLAAFQPIAAETATMTNVEPITPPWSMLKYTAAKFGLTASAQIYRETHQSKKESTRLIPADKQIALLPSQEHLTLLTLTSQYAGQRITFTSWLEPPTGRVLQSIRTRENFSQREEKVYRFTEEGMLQIKRRDGKESLQAVNLAAYPAYLEQLSQPIFLFYLVSTSPHLNKVNATATLPIYANSSVYLLHLRVSEKLQMLTHYIQAPALGPKAARYVDALRIDITSQPVDPQVSNDPISIAGLEKGITLYIEEMTRIPIELRGEMAVFGEVRYKLDEITP